MKATIEVEFEAMEGQPKNALDAALLRGVGELTVAIEYGVARAGQTGVKKGSTKYKIISKEIV